MTSINTNIGAMTALSNLQATNKAMGALQDQISTGLKIGSAKDNAATWSVAETMRTDKAGFDKISEGLGLAQSTVAVGRTAAESVVKLLGQIKDLVETGQGDNVDHSKLKKQIDDLFDQIGGVIGSAQFNGRNILDAKQGASSDGKQDMKILSSLDRAHGGGAPTASFITVEGQQLSDTLAAAATGSNITATATDGSLGQDIASMKSLVVFTASGAFDSDVAGEALGNVEKMIAGATDGAAALGSAEKRLSIQQDFMRSLSDTFEQGISNLVDADMTEASAKLTALQTQQQLGIQALSIANTAPQQLLSLFRG